MSGDNTCGAGKLGATAYDTFCTKKKGHPEVAHSDGVVTWTDSVSWTLKVPTLTPEQVYETLAQGAMNVRDLSEKLRGVFCGPISPLVLHTGGGHVERVAPAKTDAARAAEMLLWWAQYADLTGPAPASDTRMPRPDEMRRIAAALSPATLPDATPAAKPDAPSADDANAANVRRLLAQGEAEQRGNARYEKRGTPDTFAMPKPDAPGGERCTCEHAADQHTSTTGCLGDRCPCNWNGTPPPSPPETARPDCADCQMPIQGVVCEEEDGNKTCVTCSRGRSIDRLCAEAVARDAELAKVRAEADNIHALWESTDLVARKQADEIASLRSEAKLFIKQRDYFVEQRAAAEREIASLRARLEEAEKERDAFMRNAGRAETRATEAARRIEQLENGAHADAQTILQKTREVDALAGFKAYVHKRLDDANVPTHPDGPHSKEGCRIGDRLDFILDAHGRDSDKLVDAFDLLRRLRDCAQLQATPSWIIEIEKVLGENG